MGDTQTLRLYNTLTRTKEVFTPIDPDNVRMYVCGPTVYDYAHIGNARPVIVFDLLFRLLRHLYGESHVTYARNITDVDDKINARAVRDFPGLELNEAIRRVTETTANQYQKDTKALGALEPTYQPRATDNIPQMQTLITSLIGSQHAYEAAGEVLFAVDSMPDYGKLSGRNLEDNVAGARIAVEAHKRNPADFVLWKQSSDTEPGWPSPWGRGRPGWHIECSAMSERYLGQVFDIHAGGLDLIFPHHENEIAQSRCAHGTPTMANYWLHNGFLQVEGQKMSKSLGNFITIHDLLETEKFGGRKWPGEVLRLAMLMTHYRKPIDFSVKRLQEAETQLNRWAEVLAEQEVPADEVQGGAVPTHLLQALADDLNTPLTFATLNEIAVDAKGGTSEQEREFRNSLWLLGFDPALLVLSRQIEGLAIQGRDFEAHRESLRAHIVEVLVRQQPDELEALLDSYRSTESDADVEQIFQDAFVDFKVVERLTALRSADYQTADLIRKELGERGIQLTDYKDESGTRQTKWEAMR